MLLQEVYQRLLLAILVPWFGELSFSYGSTATGKTVVG